MNLTPGKLYRFSLASSMAYVIGWDSKALNYPVENVYSDDIVLFLKDDGDSSSWEIAKKQYKILTSSGRVVNVLHFRENQFIEL